MAKPNGTAAGIPIKSTKEEEEDDVNPQWGTWEELLLAFAVNRYGTDDWDSVAAEIKKRSSFSNPLLLTPPNCLKKYLQLTRQHRISDDSVPLLEELRKLRVAELRRELERNDLSIVSLQSKINKMKEERARSCSENKERNSSDLSSSKHKEKKVEIDRNLPEAKVEIDRNLPESKVEPDKSPVSVAGKAVTGEENESVPIDRRIIQNKEIRAENLTEEKPVIREEDSCYGSSDSVEKEEPASVRKGVKVERGSVSHSPELVESVAESKEEDGGRGQEDVATTATTKEDCSDVQSSATKSRRDGDRDQLLRGSSDPDDLETKRESPAVKIESSVESQPLIDFLDDLTRHKLGSVFLRRLDVQETSSYRNLIRQHIDLEMVQTRVKQGVYLVSHLKFFRDLLLLVNNATVFFNKNTSEFAAATEIRKLISNKLSQKPAKSDSASDKQSSLPRVHPSKKDNSEPSESLPLKPKLGGPLIFCRKRSSIAAKATSSSSGSDKKKEQVVTKSSEEKVAPEAKQLLPSKAEEPRVTKKRSRDGFSSGSTELKKNGDGKNVVSSVSKPTSGSSLEKSQGKGGSSSQQPEPRGESKNKSASVDLKKRGAANFLNRMKQNSSSNNNGPLLDALKSAPLRGGSEQKKNENAKGSGNGKKEQVPSKSSDSKQTKEKEKEKASPPKKSLGRPTKKSAARATPPPPPPPSAKRNREVKESESVGTNHKRKRSRK